jgi:hypothetical protein
MDTMFCHASWVSSTKVPAWNYPSALSAGMPLMKHVPLTSPERLKGNPEGSPGPAEVRLIVILRDLFYSVWTDAEASVPECATAR